MDTMEHSIRKKIRQHPAALRQQVTACEQPGVCVARVAQSHGLNANMVHAWRRQDRVASVSQDTSLPSPAPQFIALPLPAGAAVALPDIRIELRRGATTVGII